MEYDYSDYDSLNTPLTTTTLPEDPTEHGTSIYMHSKYKINIYLNCTL